VTVAATTTLFHKPNVGSASGWQEDIGPVVGYGRYVTDTVALELDIGPSFVHGSGYSGLFLVPPRSGASRRTSTRRRASWSSWIRRPTSRCSQASVGSIRSTGSPSPSS
jgi:hypothetical protein